MILTTLINVCSAQYYYTKCNNYKSGSKNALGLDLFNLPAGETCEIDLSSPNTGNGAMRVLT